MLTTGARTPEAPASGAPAPGAPAAPLPPQLKHAQTLQALQAPYIAPSLRTYHVVLEITRAIGLRPEAHLAAHRGAKYGIVLRQEIGIGRRAVASRRRSGAEHVAQHLR